MKLLSAFTKIETLLVIVVLVFVVAGMSSNVKIEKDGRVLDRTDDLEAAGEGWKINADGLLLLKLKQDQPLARINVTSK